LGINELVVNDLDIGIVGREETDLVGDSLGVRKGRYILSDASKAQNDVLPARSA
jgi:hypothetical protein